MRPSCFSSDPARNGRVRPLAQVESLDSLLFQQFATCFLISSQHLFSSNNLQHVFSSHLNISSLPAACNMFSHLNSPSSQHLFSSNSLQRVFSSSLLSQHSLQHKHHLFSLSNRKHLSMSTSHHFEIWRVQSNMQYAFLECHLNAGLVHHYTLSVHQAFLRIPCTSFHPIPPSPPCPCCRKVS